MNKISADHLVRRACVYIRQSTPGQVQHNLESQRRQYALVDRARALGWKDIDVIDDDLGISGSGTLRHGLERLLRALCDGQVGAVFSIEASRLARNGRDWHTLLEFCSNGQASFAQEEQAILISVRPRKRSTAIGSGCHQPAPGYDQSRTPRRFEFIGFWGYLVFLVYCMRRVHCKQCGVVVEEVPWGMGKHASTKVHMHFLGHWARKLSWKETAQEFRTSWDKVHDAVEYLVTWGLEHRVLGTIRAIGVDEIQRGKGHKYLTLVYQIDLGCTRLLWIGKERTVKTFREFFAVIGPEVSAKIEFVCSDMWKPYLGVIREKCSQALNILDRFHIVAKVNKALDDIRSAEARRMKGDGYEPVLTKSRWCLLKRPANLTANQKVKLKDLVRYNLQSVRAYLLKEDFQQLWNYESTAWAAKFLDQWCRQVMRSRIEPMKKVARTLRAHRELILNYFRARKEFSSGKSRV